MPDVICTGSEAEKPKKDYKAIHADKIAEMKEKVLGSSIAEKLEVRAISNKEIESIISKMNKILAPREVWTDFNFRTGAIFGIMRSLAQNPKLRKELLEATGLTQDYVDMYFQYCGNLPYLHTSNNTLNQGRPMKIEETKELITAVALKFGYVVEESDLFDITQERWDRLYQEALEKVTKTMQHNAEHGDSVPEAGYDE